MTLDDLIKAAADTNKLLDPAAVDQVANALGTSVNDLCGLFAVTVAQRYLKGEYSYEFADGAMNALFGFGTSTSSVDMPAISWQVFEAFDEGEYDHPGEPLQQQGEVRTRALLRRIRTIDGA